MLFTPIIIPALILEPLRYFFETYGPSIHKGQFVWKEDEKERTVDLDYTENFYRIPLEDRPRIIVDRGQFSVNKVGLSDNLAEQHTFHHTQGLKNRINMMFYAGQATVTVEARHKGSCELVADMATHFILWTRPELCDSQGFKEFGLPMNVSPCSQVTRENDVKFQVQIGLPWMREEHWRVRNDGVKIKDLLIKAVPGLE